MGVEGEEGEARVSDFFFTKNPIQKKIDYFFFFLVGGGGGGGLGLEYSKSSKYWDRYI